jgi:N-acetylglucosaminyl-diphospho-decaprenol L-rhamnosyltransferase
MAMPPIDPSAYVAEPAKRIGIVTVTYRSNDVLPSFLDSIAASSSERVEVVVVDNYPGEGSRASELAEGAGARYVALPRNPGYGGGMNAGVAALPDAVQWVLITNPDVVLHPGVIDTLLNVALLDSTIGAVGPAVVNPDGSVYPSARRVPSLRTGIGHALFVNLWRDNPWTQRYLQDSASIQPRDAGWLSGACLLVRRDVFALLGGFDDGYFMYFEDVDFGYRLGKAGLRNRYEPGAVVTHVGGHTADRDSAIMIRAHHDSARRFLGRKYSGWCLAPLRFGLSAGLRLRSAFLERRSRTACQSVNRR